jgi:hypothetical protein
MIIIIFYEVDKRYICSINGKIYFYFENKTYKLTLNLYNYGKNFTQK